MTKFSNDNFLNVCTFGATGDGTTLDMAALQAALDACQRQGGGTVFVPAGRYVTGPLFLHSHTTLHLDAGACLLGSEDIAHYPVLDGRWEGKTQPAYASLIGGQQLENVTITGRGTVDGRGAHWWQRFREKSIAYPRPRLIGLAACRNVLIENVTLINSPSWTVNPVRCENVTVRGITIDNPPDSPNTDGINPDSCRWVRISDCHISAGDDCITLKSGVEAEAPELRVPCRDIAITNCTLARGHGGVVIGSEMSGNVQNVVIANCIFIGTDRGIRLKSRRGRGGVVEDIRATNLIMEGVRCPLTMNLYYACGAWGDAQVADRDAHPVDAGTPHFRRIHIGQISARQVTLAAGFLYGLAEAPVEDISLTDVSISLAGEAEASQVEMADGLEPMCRAGFFVRNARSVRLERVDIRGQEGPALLIADCSDVRVDGKLFQSS
ncbi:MAG: glycoside hydrolase family 28 protein [Chloroflexota bacterium]